MSRLWMRVIRDHRITRHEAIPCTWDNCRDALTELCRQFDIPRPLWLPKHEREFAEFQRTSFSRDHFMEEVAFDKLEIEYLADDNKKKKSTDPRNAF